jgi:TAT (twin-arginine translocation) pathway signal sequence
MTWPVKRREFLKVSAVGAAAAAVASPAIAQSSAEIKRAERGWLPGGIVGGLAALFGRRHEGQVREWAESQILNGGIVLIVHPASTEEFEAATAIMRRHCGADVFASPSA